MIAKKAERWELSPSAYLCREKEKNLKKGLQFVKTYGNISSVDTIRV